MPFSFDGVMLVDMIAPIGVASARPPAIASPPCAVWQAMQSDAVAMYLPRAIRSASAVNAGLAIAAAAADSVECRGDAAEQARQGAAHDFALPSHRSRRPAVPEYARPSAAPPPGRFPSNCRSRRSAAGPCRRGTGSRGHARVPIGRRPRSLGSLPMLSVPQICWLLANSPSLLKRKLAPPISSAMRRKSCCDRS